jgi:type II secretory pathway component GspD/PulD (secretin)
MVPALKKCVLFYLVAASIIPYGLDAWGQPKQKISRESRFKINFKQVKAEEFLQFLSEIAGLNFVYNPQDLNFSINLVSDEEMTIETIVSGFVQTLRIQGFSILEENGTLIIHQSPDIKEMPMLLSSEMLSQESVPPIVTKIYQIKNSSAETISTLIQPFLSKSSVIEAFPERKLLIISDVVQNILSIDSLVRTIDQPETGAVNIIYETQFFQPTELVSIASPILDSLCGGKSYSLLPQEGTQRVFIVGSPQLADKALEVFQQIEEKASKQQSSITTGNILLYRALNRSIQSIFIALKTIAKDSKKSEFNSSGFSKMVNEATLLVPDLLLFIGEPVEINKISSLIKTIDTPQQVKSDFTFSIIKLQHSSGKIIIDQLKSMSNDIPPDVGNADFLSALDTIRWNKDTNSIVIQGSPHVIEEITNLINKMDQPTGATAGFSVIKLQNVSGKFVLDQLQQMISQLPESSENMPFMNAVRDIQWNKTNNTLAIRGNPQVIQQLTDIITKLDVHTVSSTQHIIYTPNHMKAAELQKTLLGIANDLESSGTADPSLIQSIKGIKLIKNSNSIIVSGSEANIGKIKEMIAAVDKMEQPKGSTAEFSVIKLQNVSGKYVLDQLQQMISQLPESSENMPFINAVKDIQWNKTNNTLTIRGNPQMIQQLTDIITKLDVHAVSSTQHIIYTPNHMKAAELQKTLLGIANDLESSGTADPSLIQSIKGIKLIKNSNSIIVSGSEANIGKIKEMIAAVDKMDQPTGSTAGFSVIKLQNVSGKYVLDQLQQMISQLPESPENMPFMNAVKEIQWNKTNNTLTIQGNPQVIQQLTDIIAKLDVHTVSSTQYIIYKPNHMTAAELQKTLIGIANDLESSGTADPTLIQSIKGIKLIKNSNSLIVSGSEANIGKIKEMIAAVDSQTQSSSKISQVGTATFLSYVPKTKSAKDLLAQLKSTTKNIASENPELIKTVNDAKISEGTIVFIGTPENLDRIQKLLESFDQKIPGTSAPREVDNYQNYKPVYKTGPELIKEVQGYVEHISDNGVNNQGLTKSVENLRFLNGRIVIVGAQENVTQILKLLQEFDTPSADLTKPSTTIESYENIGFLNYKLNFHTGSDIQIALKQIGEELQLTKNTKNESLVNAIASLQWIRVTNSLVATGDPQTLQKLKEIIASVDIPLKQVFIEVLVIETDTTNTLDVGLRWGGYSNFKGKFAGVGSNYPRVDSTDGITLQDVVKGTSTAAGTSSTGVNAINAPSPNLFNSLSSGQLGIIGDIIFHGGKSYLTLSSLLTALQEEARITTVLNQKIMAQDNRMSQIFVGQNIPFTGSIITTSGISQSTNANLEYRNIGVSLNITPNIGDNGIITLEIDEEITEEANPGTDSSGVNTQAVAGIRTKKSSMQTRVHVPDKAFVVLSGQIRNTQTKAKSGLPCLGGLPVIGAAFSQSSKNDSLSDIIIFIRPEIIQTSDQWKELSEQQEDIVREQTNPEQFDRAIDLVKRD